jgi:hypothetical protein
MEDPKKQRIQTNPKRIAKLETEQDFTNFLFG